MAFSLECSGLVSVRIMFIMECVLLIFLCSQSPYPLHPKIIYSILNTACSVLMSDPVLIAILFSGNFNLAGLSLLMFI